MPGHIYGGVLKRQVRDNVYAHCGADVLVTMDIRDCFPSITPFHIYHVWRVLLNCSAEISSILTKLTTFAGHLPQGAPTSTALANLVIFSLDEPIRVACEAAHLRYSTFLDDLAFSGDNAREIINIAVQVLRRAGLAVSHKKIKIMGAGSRRVLTGYLVGNRPSIPRQRIKAARSGIHKLRAGEVPRAQRPEYIRSLEGTIAYVATANSVMAKRLLEALEDTVAKLSGE